MRTFVATAFTLSQTQSNFAIKEQKRDGNDSSITSARLNFISTYVLNNTVENTGVEFLLAVKDMFVLNV